MPAVVGGVGTLLTPSGGSDDSAFIQAYLDSGGVIALNGVFPVATTLNIRDSDTKLLGLGSGHNHDTGGGSIYVTSTSGLRWVGATGGTILSIQPTEGASNRRLAGVDVEDIGFFGLSSAATAIDIRSVMHGRFRLYVAEFTGSAVYIGVVTTLGEARDSQFNHVHIEARQLLETDGPIVELAGDATANASFNEFWIKGTYRDSTAFVMGNSDNNNVWDAQLYRVGSGTAAGVVIKGHASEGQVARSNRFWHLSPGAGGVTAQGEETATYPSRHNTIYSYDKENGAPDPTVGTNASLFVSDDWEPIAPLMRAMPIDIVNGSTGWSEAVGLSFQCDEDHVYTYRFWGSYTVGNVATGLALGVNHAGGVAVSTVEIHTDQAGTKVVQTQLSGIDFGLSATGTTSASAIDEAHYWSIEGRFVCQTPGTFTIGFTRRGTASDVTIKGGSGGLVSVIAI